MPTLFVPVVFPLFKLYGESAAIATALAVTGFLSIPLHAYCYLRRHRRAAGGRRRVLVHPASTWAPVGASALPLTALLRAGAEAPDYWWIAAAIQSESLLQGAAVRPAYPQRDSGSTTSPSERSVGNEPVPSAPSAGRRWTAESRGATAARPGHSYDIAREGYTHLLPANRKHSKMPGDDKGMAAARQCLSQQGLLRRPAGCPVQSGTGPLLRSIPAVLDTGCGEGYYTSGVYRALRPRGKIPCMAGTDISKAILRRAAKREKDVEFAVASSYHLPVADAVGRPAAELLLPAGAGGIPAGAAARRARFSMWCRRRSTCGS